MAARSIWNGTIRFENVTLPVKLYSAIQDRTIHFHLLHDKDKQQLKQKMVDPETDEEVPPQEMRRGYEVEPGVFVMLEEDELAKLDIPGSRDIEVTRFIDAGHIDPSWYERPYYLGPDGESSKYFALSEALAESGKEGVAHWKMRKRQYVGGLRTEGDYLMLVTLRHAGEVISVSELDAPSGPPPSKGERAMADQLISMLEEEFDPADYEDEYRQRVLELIEAKSRGKKFAFERARRERRPDDLEKALAASLTRMKKKERAVA